MASERLYGVPGAEELYDDPAACWEQQIEPWVDEHDDPSWVIEEWSVHPPSRHLPHPDFIIEHVCEWIADCGEVSEGADEDWERRGKDPEVVAALEAWLALWASTVTWRQADDLLRTITVTLDAEGRPLLDGEPMYVKRTEEDDRGPQ